MGNDRHYSAASIRSAAAHFVVGKAVAAGLGVAWLIVLLRYMALPDYAAYVVLLAVFEIANAFSGFGIPEVVQRFLPEARVRGNSREFETLLFKTLQFRMLSVALTSGVLLLAFDAIAGLAGLSPPAGLAPLFAGFFAAESLLRYFNDHLLGALLAQKTAQRIQIAKNSARLLAVLVVLGLSSALTLATAFYLELGSAMCALVFAFPAAKQLRAGGRQQQSAAGAPLLEWRRMFRFGIFSYLTICLYQIYGLDTLKLVVSRLLGAAETASYGMAAAVSETVRRYLPLFLFHGVIRPSLVARFAENGSYEQQNHLCNLVFKINLVFLAPVVAFMAVSGDVFGAWVSGGKYPAAGVLLTLMTALVASQALRLVFAMLSSVYTFPATNLWATVASMLALPTSILLGREYGSIGVLGGTLSGDLIWIGVVFVRLRIAGRPYVPEGRGIGKLIVAAVVGWGLASALAPYTENLFGIALAGLVVTGGFVGAAFLLMPFSKSDRETMAKLIPESLRFGTRGK